MLPTGAKNREGGGREEILVDTRILAATNQDLGKAVIDGKFREDLYYRLNVVTIQVPPLRKRQGDLLYLAKALLQKFSQESKKRIIGFSEEAIQAIEGYGWPGNIRELENRIKRAVIMSEGKYVNPEDMELASPHEKSGGKGLKKARESFEKDFIKRALDENKWNITKAADELGVSRPTLYELIEKLGIAKPAKG